MINIDDGQILHWGYVLDSLTSTRVLNYYKKYPKICQFWQNYSPFGKTLSMRLGDEYVNLMNSKTITQKIPTKISVGGGFVQALNSKINNEYIPFNANNIFYSDIINFKKTNCIFTFNLIIITKDDGTVFGLGENYKGQLGTGDLGFKHHFEQLKFDTKDKIIDVACGYQHSIFLTESGYLYGSGRANWHQIVPITKENNSERAYGIFQKVQMKMQWIITRYQKEWLQEMKKLKKYQLAFLIQYFQL